MRSLRFGIGIAIALLNHCVMSMQDDYLRAELAYIVPICTMIIWQLVIHLVARQAAKRATRAATVKTVDTFAHGEQTLDLIIEAYETSAAHQGTR